MSTTPKIALAGKCTRRLMTKLSEKEREERGINLAVTQIDMLRLEEEAKTVAADFKDRIGGLKARSREESVVVSRGEEYRDVECEIKYGVPSKTHKTIVRKDTGETVAVEPMSPNEFQPKLITVEGGEEETEDEA
jgi:hypothetical protein